MFHKPLILAAALTVAGCMSQSDIQSKYVMQQDDCRELVANNLSRVQGGANNPAASTTAGLQFSECMNKAGWHVSMPKPNTQIVVNNPPTGSPSTNPSAALSAPASAPAMGSIAPSEGTSTIVRPATRNVATANPPSGSPSVAPSAAMSAPVTTPAPTINTPTQPLPASAPATYQPGRPVPTTSAPAYGQGAGRQF